jgi:transposase
MAKSSKEYSTFYPCDVSDEEWEFCAPYLTLMNPEAPQRLYPLRALFNALRYIAKTGVQWRYLPENFPPYSAVYQQAQRWIRAGVLETMAGDLRKLLRLLQDRASAPSAVILDGRTLQSVPESGARAGYDGYKRKKGSKAHVAVDTLGHLLAVTITPANEQERAQVSELCQQVQEATAQNVQIAFVDQGYTGQDAAQQAQAHAIDLVVVQLAEAKKGFVLLPRRWVVERTFAWLGRFRRLARDYERTTKSLAAYHWLAAISLMLGSLCSLLQSA